MSSLTDIQYINIQPKPASLLICGFLTNATVPYLQRLAPRADGPQALHDAMPVLHVGACAAGLRVVNRRKGRGELRN